ncbi:nicotinate-nucleotide--dimethylbenzimidazole phosphoribosyltransferase [Flammeovirga kamogawensis]|uniref:Nicotinate-nucleotide--dimethylbenzimidazole phosphoribosyltransferase n=1 Tax=Flammeovirga kamogawensis TaxID=373891 RepID=A0ABX8GSE0_9BACT|nr:nicotinate-nucleotide--dimethylbenzimidazole phosphoribosyltransferase [Flammeovirga kamogawensis]MBB6463719.1 nicotinate-nucleotide--dimethylbenzimidazole phosphoribosyltransferase [Flammeovirga kamogawensis]QWG06218.1 nicotinate-nucleotide--dimethylbenzimidazole phosphoribosyltransferase [Flammeovirga kamogawensis]TRX68049.1 nicotinate-nucleotide--dimethylbenzimidazole phosphoribosyltransferase [Flammeovirga kamogawensis]
MSLTSDIQQKIDLKTKPIGALGELEDLAKQICLVQNTTSPTLNKPTIIVFAADHGLAKEGVSAYPQEVTFQMVHNFLNGGAAINVFANQHKIQLKIVDAGVNHDFGNIPDLINAKIGNGTQNMLHGPALSSNEIAMCFDKAKEIINSDDVKDADIIGFGEMGIGNTSSATLIMSALYNLRLDECIGKGTGVDLEGFKKKFNVLEQVKQKHGDISSAIGILSAFGGYEICMIAAAMLEAASLKKMIMVDGFIVSSAYAIAKTLNPDIQKNAIFSHVSDEKGHTLLLQKLEANPLLHLGMRLGEGTGTAMAFPIVQSAVNFMNEMASFSSANVSNK